MKRYFTLLMFVAAIGFSCKKETTDPPVDSKLSGNWKMISIKNDTTTITRPAGLQRDINVKIAFLNSTSGKMSVTLTQSSAYGDFTINALQSFSVPWLSIVSSLNGPGALADWDKQFLYNITLATNYKIDSTGNLSISCLNRSVMKFEKE